MPDSTPPLGLLLDVDGPIASPVERRIAIPSITRDLVVLANLGVPVVFNTGRSDVFVRDEIVKPMLAAGLEPDARVYGVCEKGAVWFAATLNHFDGVNVEQSVAVPPIISDDVHELVQDEYSDTMFWDDTKRAMVSVEARTDVAASDYLDARVRFDERVFELIAGRRVGVVMGDRRSGETVTLRIDRSIIATDVESVTLGKDLGAQRALTLLAASGALPSLWRTVGDSRTDYAMADYLHAHGYDVAHVDVRPADGVPEKPYRVITEGDLVHDEAGAAFLAHWVRELG